MRTESTAVLVVGGGLVGLSAAVFLSWRGVPTIVVERHAGSSPHPRAVGYAPRTVELYRAVGLEPAIPPAPGRLGAGVRRVRVASLAGEWFDELHWTPKPPPEQPSPPAVEYSPCAGAGLAQDRLEPILRDIAAKLSADIRLSTEMLSFEQDRDGVRAVLRTADGLAYAVRADYLVAADGHRSPVREALDIARGGRGYLHTGRSVLFRAPLEDYLESGFCQFVIDQPEFDGFLTTYGDGRWVLFHADHGEPTPDALQDMVTRAIGRSDLNVEIITTGRWVITAWIADRYARDRVFLAGDAAHTLPPSRGGYGTNTGIEDAHNLAWKLAAVLSGASTPRLLDSYDAERRPVAWLCHQQIFAHNDGQHPTAPTQDVPIIDDQAMTFGCLYRSGAVIGAGAELPPALRPEQWAGQPGTRAPHLWLTKNGQRLSTLDLFQRGWVLLVDSDRWLDAAKRASASTRIMVDCHRIGTDLQPEQPDALQDALGLTQGGAALVRPDGYLAWRSRALPAHPASTLTHALGYVASATHPDISDLTQ